MSNTSFALSEHLPIDFQAIFESMPGSFIVLHPDAPHYTILAITSDLLDTIGRKKEDTIGKGIFEVYPEGPEAITALGPSKLRVSLQNTIKFKKQDQMQVVRDDVPNAAGVLEERYLSVSNKPVLDEGGKVLYIIHAISEVTDKFDSEQQVRAIIESSYHPIGVYTGKNLEIKFANKGLIDRLGKGNNIIGKRYKELLPELEAQGTFEILDQVLATGVPFHAENERMELIVDGKVKVFYFNFSLSPLINSAGQVYGIVNTGADITELNEARQKTEESESRFRNMVEQAPVAFALTRGLDTVIESINAPMLRLMNKKDKAAVLGKKMIEVLPEIEDQQILAIAQQVFVTGQASKGTEVEVYLQINNTFKPIYIDYSYTPVVEAGKITGVLHVAIDVTEKVLARKMIESREELKRFKFMADETQDPFILMREDGTFAYLNKKALEAWGYSEQEARHIRVPDVDPVYQEELFAGLFARAQKETIPQFETLHKRKDGYIYPVEVNVNRLTLEGQPHLLAVARDITRRKQAEEALELNNAQLIRTNKDLDDFIYTASHDLKTPILNIEGLMVALLEDIPADLLKSPNLQRTTHLILDSVRRFKRTVEHLTEITKLQKENSWETSLINLADMIAEVQLDLAPTAQAKQAQIEVNVTDCPMIVISEKHLRSIIYNLLSNAIKYRSPERTPEIRISCYPEEEFIVLKVQDNGLGMDLKSENKLFTIFGRLHDHVEGSGIGLYMVKKIIEKAGGKIDVQSIQGEGSTFCIYFKRS